LPLQQQQQLILLERWTDQQLERNAGPSNPDESLSPDEGIASRFFTDHAAPMPTAYLWIQAQILDGANCNADKIVYGFLLLYSLRLEKTVVFYFNTSCLTTHLIENFYKKI
jgi:hypothetical protein